jgi:hypothetical protein
LKPLYLRGNPVGTLASMLFSCTCFHSVVQVKQVLPHNLMCNPLTGQAVSRKVKQPANLAKREER